eukprot:scaffold8804_cov161-Ochromonas_danica.AAC.6
MKVKYSMDGYNTGFERDNAMYTVITNQLQANQLVKLDLSFPGYHHHSEVVSGKIGELLLKHADSLKAVALNDRSMENHFVIDMLETLTKAKCALISLVIESGSEDTRDIKPSLLLECLSSVGMHLETFRFNIQSFFLTEEMWPSIGALCPKLVKLSLPGASEVTKPSAIFRNSPNLKCLRLEHFSIDVNEAIDKLSLGCEFSKLEDGIECLLIALHRRQYSKVNLTIPYFENEYDGWTLVKAKTDAVLTSIEIASTISEDVLVDVLPAFPRLQVLDLSDASYDELTNRSLAAIAEHGQNLIELLFSSVCEHKFTDEMISEMIRKCTMLEVLVIPCAGLGSILSAAKHLPRLRRIELDCVSVSRAEIRALLDNVEVQWPSSLREGEIRNDDDVDYDDDNYDIFDIYHNYHPPHHHEYFRYSRRSRAWLDF